MSSLSGNANIIPLLINKPGNARSEAAMNESLARLPRPMQRIREVAQTHLKTAIQQLFDHVDDALFELADRASSNLEQNVFFESMREIRIQRRSMEKTFLYHIDSHFAGLVSTGQSAGMEMRDSSDDADISTDDLSLVSKDELEELVAIDSLVSKAWAQNKNSLRVLAARMNSLVNAAVTEKNNPLTPRSLADSFVEAASLITIDIKAKLVLFKLFERYVMNELTALLNEVNRALTEQGVPIPKSPRRGGPASQQSHARRESDATASGVNMDNPATGLYATLQSLIQPHTSSPSQFAESGYATHSVGDYSVTDVSYALLHALSQLQQQQLQQAPVAESLRSGRPELLTGDHIQSAIQSATGQELVDERSQDVIKLVDMLFSFILEDGNLPDPVKLLLSRLQIPFIKVALADEEFFKKDGHPARRLLNEMAMASIGWNGDVDSNKRDPLLSKIESTVNKILTEFDSNFEIFTLLLTDFIAFMEKERRRVMLFEKRAIDAEDGKAKSEVGRQQVDERMTALMSGKLLPDVFTAFIEGPWSNILFLIYMRQGTDSQQWTQALRVAKELVWSALPIQSDEHQQKLIALLPRLQSALKKGLDSISFNPVKQTKFLSRFTEHHTTLFELYQQGVDQQQVVEERRRKDIITEQNEDPAASVPLAAELSTPTTPVVAIETVDDDVKQDTVVDKVSDVEAALVPAQPAAEPVAEPQYLNLVDNFTVGVWFEKIDENASPYRCRLAAIIRGTGKYIFVNRSGIKVAEETRDTLAMQLQKGKLRTLDDSMLFDRALESVITSLRQPR